MQVGGHAVAGEAGAVGLPFRHLGQLGADQVGQGEVLEEDPHELFLGEAEDEVVFAAFAIAGLRAAARAAAALLRPLDAVALDVLAIAGMHVLAVAALAMAEHWLGDIALGQGDVLALLEIANAAAADGAPHGFADLLAITPQETLAVADGLVLPRQTAVDDLLQHGHGRNSFQLIMSSCERADTTHTTGGPAWRCNPSAPCG